MEDVAVDDHDVIGIDRSRWRAFQIAQALLLERYERLRKKALAIRAE